MPIAKSYYEILGIRIDSDEVEIRTAYRKTIRKFHPDLNQDDRRSEKRTRQLNVALEVLTNPNQRKRYDEKLKRMGKAEANKEFESEARNASWTEVSPSVFRSSESGSGDCPESSGPSAIPEAFPFSVDVNPTSNSSSRRKTKGTRRGSRKIQLIGHILAPLLGLTVGWLILRQIRPEIFNFHDTKSAVDENHSADGSPKASINGSSNLVQKDETGKNQSEESVMNPVPEIVDKNAIASTQSPGPVIQKSSPQLPPSVSEGSLADNTEVPAAPSMKVRFTKLKESARADLDGNELRNLVRQCLKLLDDSKTENDPPLAKKIAELALISARKSNDQSLIRQATLAVVSAASMKKEDGEDQNE